MLRKGNSKDLDTGSTPEGDEHDWQGQPSSPGRESPPETSSDPAEGGVPGKQQSQQPSPGDTKQGG